MLGQEMQSRLSGGLVGFLDIGSTKNACIIAVPDKQSRRTPLGATIVGVANMRSRGVKSGLVIDVDAAQKAVSACINEAELMSGDKLRSVHVSFSCGRLASEICAAHAEVPGGVIGGEDIARCLRAGRSYASRNGRRLVHMNELSYDLDGTPGARDPRGLAASRLTAHLHAVTAEEAPLRNLSMLIERCYLKTASMRIAPYASALAASTEDERKFGITVIDIGGATTKIAVFFNGRFVHTDVIAVGSGHITADIARALQASFAEAERIKTLYGTLVSARSDSHEAFSYEMTGGEEAGLHHANKAQLSEIIAARASMIASLISEKLNERRAARYVGDRIVLTGGGAELVGMADFMAARLGRSVRLGRPGQNFRLPDNISGPGFSTVLGMVAAGFSPPGSALGGHDREAAPLSYLGRVGQWLMTGL